MDWTNEQECLAAVKQDGPFFHEDEHLPKGCLHNAREVLAKAEMKCKCGKNGWTWENSNTNERVIMCEECVADIKETSVWGDENHNAWGEPN